MSSPPDRLELLCEVNRRLATFASLDELLRFATSRTRELFDAEGCSLLLADRERGEFRFPVSSQSARSGVSSAELQEIRFPLTQGIAGWVLEHGEPVAVDDVQADSRFYSGVDQSSGATTRRLLAAPLRTSVGTIGVIEVLNPRNVADGDLAFLSALGSDVAIAHERAAVQSALRDEAAGLRRLGRLGGLVLVVIGLGIAAVGFLAHAARALPMTDLATEPGVPLGFLVAVAGAILAVAVRRVPSAQ